MTDAADSDLAGVVVVDQRHIIVAADTHVARAWRTTLADLLGRDAQTIPEIDTGRALRVELEEEDIFILRLPHDSRWTPSIGLRDALRATAECQRLTASSTNEASLAAHARLTNIVRQLRGLAMRAATRDLAVRLPRVSVVEVALAALRATGRDRPEATRVTVDCASAPPTVRGSDVSLLEHALVNVLRNSCEALLDGDARGPSIAVRLGETELTSWIEVEDNGRGLSEASVAHAFQAGFSTKGSSHLGMGLPVARRILGLLEGTVTLRSGIGGPTIARLEWHSRADDDGGAS